MDWQDAALVLSVRRHGENAVILTLLTERHGRHGGLVRAGRQGRIGLEPGAEVVACWRGRLAEHLGTLRCEVVRNHAAELLDAPGPLAGLSAACAMIDATVPERAPDPALYEASRALLDQLRGRFWAAAYIRWEVGLLAALGYGLDLSACALSGATTGLAYVSPRSGRAVGALAGQPYGPKLLRLPAFLIGEARAEAANAYEAQVVDGLRLTGYFFDKHVFAPRGRQLPAARQRLALRCARLVGAGDRASG